MKLKLGLLLGTIGLLVTLPLITFSSRPVAPPAPTIIQIKPGSGAYEIAQNLNEQQIITNAELFMILAVLSGRIKYLQAGTYIFDGARKPGDVINMLFKGQIYQLKLTVPEGANIFDIANGLAKLEVTGQQDFLSAARSIKTCEFFQIEAPSMEGFLYPDTYYLAKEMTPIEIMGRMVSRFHQAYPASYEQRAAELNLSRLEVVTLASIIEREAVVQDEKPLISSVFHNRLKRGMRLQSDPTAVYGRADFNGGKIRPEDLRNDNPYNTYRNGGLPPGPIANPDATSIKAALWPAETKYLYFVARGGGRHTFSTNLKDHNRAVAELRRLRH